MLVRLLTPYLHREYSLGVLFVSFMVFMFSAIFLFASIFFFANEPSALASETRIYKEFVYFATAINGVCSVIAIYFIYKFFISGAQGILFGFLAFLIIASLDGIRFAFEPALVTQARNVIYTMGACLIVLVAIWYLKLRDKH